MYDFYYFALTPDNGNKRSLEFNIALADDDPLFLETLKDYLASMNIDNIETYSTGESLLATIKKGDRRFIISDFDFGGNGRMNGLELLEAVKKIDSAIPFVVLSAQDNLRVAMDTLRSGALDYFIKGQESTFTTVLTSLLKTNEIFRLKKDRKDFATLGIIGMILFTLLLILSFYYR